MRIVAGRWAGRSLTSPAGRVRPTAERMRELAMQRIAAELKGARVLDLYAGTGALGLEALSRGARSVDFVENGPAALHALKANVAALRTRERTRIFKREALRFLHGIEPPGYDVAFADPPYRSRQAVRVAEHWLERPFSRVLLVEHSISLDLPSGGRTEAVEQNALTLYRRRPD